MKRFAELLDRLGYEPGRNNKLRLMTDYFRTVPDPERGWALAALTGALSFQHAKPGMLRALIEQRADPVLFGLSWDYVGDLSETIALMWPAPKDTSAKPQPPTLSDVITGLATLGKSELPAQLARWLDALDETGRWALLKLVTGGMRIGISARLAKTAAAALGGTAEPIPEHLIARACALVSEPGQERGRVIPFTRVRLSPPTLPGVARWASLAAALVLASWLGFDLGSATSAAFAPVAQSAEDSLLRDLLEPSAGFVRDLTEGVRT